MINISRVERIRENMKKHNLNQLIISSKESIFYITGLKFDPGERMMILYISQDKESFFMINDLFPVPEDFGIEIIKYNDAEDPIEILSKMIVEDKILGVDKEWPSHFLIRTMKKLKNIEVDIGSIVVDEARMIKDEEEIEKMRNASKVNDLAMEEVVKLLESGKYSELDIKKAIPDIYSKYGTYDVSFSPSVSYGENAADPHHESEGKMPKKGECVVIDMGRNNRRILFRYD